MTLRIPWALRISLLTLAVLAENHNSNDHSHWHYYSDGVDRWPGMCKGEKQSPIDIVDHEIVHDVLDELRLFNYDRPVGVETENNGHSVIFLLNPEDDLYVMGGGLEGSYSLKQIHFHWQSEHTRNGKRSPLEAHFVHALDSHRNCRSTDGEHQPERYHVFSVMYYLSEKSNDNMLNVIGSIQQTSKVSSKYNATFNIRKLLPENIHEFYRYEGSLTTPNCAEIVHWSIFRSGIPISLQQYEVFGDIETFNGTRSINYRPTQKLNNRIVKSIKTIKRTEDFWMFSGAETNTSSITILIVVLALCNLFYTTTTISK